MRPRVVCFDLGGVLVRIHRSWEELARAAGKPVRDVDLSGAAQNRVQSSLIAYQRGTITIEEMAAQVSDAMAGVYDPDEIVALHRAQLRDEYEGVGGVISDLGAADVTCAILSNTCADHWARLVTYPAVASIAHRFASHEIGALKPEAAAYTALEEGLKVRGPQILFFDDTPPNVQAARDHGWRAFWIDPEGATASQMRAALGREGVLL